MDCPICTSAMGLKDRQELVQHIEIHRDNAELMIETAKKPATVRLRGSSSLRIPELITIQIPLNSSSLHRKLDTLSIRTILSTQRNWTKDELLDRLRNMKEAPLRIHSLTFSFSLTSSSLNRFSHLMNSWSFFIVSTALRISSAFGSLSRTKNMSLIKRMLNATKSNIFERLLSAV